MHNNNREIDNIWWGCIQIQLSNTLLIRFGVMLTISIWTLYDFEVKKRMKKKIVYTINCVYESRWISLLIYTYNTHIYLHYALYILQHYMVILSFQLHSKKQEIFHEFLISMCWTRLKSLKMNIWSLNKHEYVF